MTYDAHDVIRQAMIAEAVDEARNSGLYGRELIGKIQSLSEEYNLTEDETNEVVQQATDPSNMDSPNTLWFDSEEELEEAIGLLMYRKIAWESKGEYSGYYYIELADQDTLVKANTILKNKWNLVDFNQRASAIIQFDSIAEYLKVLDYIKKEGMIVEFGNTGTPFKEDYDLEVSGSKKPKESTLANYEGAFIAKDKKETFDHDPKPYDDEMDRFASVRKNWA